MIHRIWRGWTAPADADAYERLLRTTVLPGIEARGAPGYRGATVHRRVVGGEVEFMTLLRFDTLEGVRALAGPDPEVAYVPDAARALLARWDERVAHYEVAHATAAPEGTRLAQAVRAAARGPCWHGPSLAESVAGVDAEVAAARAVPGAHSIQELVLHVGAWAEMGRERVLGHWEEVTAERNFPPATAAGPGAWTRAVDGALERLEALAAVVAGLDDEGLEAVGERGQTPRIIAGGVAEHTIYHAGQIALLRRAAGVEPPGS